MHFSSWQDITAKIRYNYVIHWRKVLIGRKMSGRVHDHVSILQTWHSSFIQIDSIMELFELIFAMQHSRWRLVWLTITNWSLIRDILAISWRRPNLLNLIVCSWTTSLSCTLHSLVTRTYTIVHFASISPIRWLAGKIHKLAKYVWPMASKGHAYDVVHNKI